MYLGFSQRSPVYCPSTHPKLPSTDFTHQMQAQDARGGKNAHFQESRSIRVRSGNGIVNNVNTALVDPDKGPKLLVLGCIWVTQGPCGLGACPGCVSVARGCCVGFKWHFSVKMARWSTPRVPFRGTRGVFWGARGVVRKRA